jgi:hypothetical protein
LAEALVVQTDALSGKERALSVASYFFSLVAPFLMPLLVEADEMAISDYPSMVPSDSPSLMPSDFPSSIPSDFPSNAPNAPPLSA